VLAGEYGALSVYEAVRKGRKKLSFQRLNEYLQLREAGTLRDTVVDEIRGKEYDVLTLVRPGEFQLTLIGQKILSRS
jgi:hypothetical protein